MDYSKLRSDKFGLVKVLTRTLKVPLLLRIPPRLALLGFTFCQPFFIEKLLDQLCKPKVDANVGYGLIGASILIYSGIGISTALYWYSASTQKLPVGSATYKKYRYFHYRMRTMARSILVTEIFIKATKACIRTGDNTAALTLMSIDIERIDMGFRSLHIFGPALSGFSGWLDVVQPTWRSLHRTYRSCYSLLRRLDDPYELH